MNFVPSQKKSNNWGTKQRSIEALVPLANQTENSLQHSARNALKDEVLSREKRDLTSCDLTCWVHAEFLNFWSCGPCCAADAVDCPWRQSINAMLSTQVASTQGKVFKTKNDWGIWGIDRNWISGPLWISEILPLLDVRRGRLSVSRKFSSLQKSCLPRGMEYVITSCTGSPKRCDLGVTKGHRKGHRSSKIFKQSHNKHFPRCPSSTYKHQT